MRYIAQASKTRMPAVMVWNVSVASPMSGGVAAPPATAVIISPAMRLACSGSALTATAKMVGKMQEHRKPMAPIRASVTGADTGVHASTAMTAMQVRMFAL